MFNFSGLEGKRVKLVPLEMEHVEPLILAAKDPEIWDQYPIRIQTLEEMNQFILKAVKGRQSKEQYPYAVFDKELNQFVGSTRFLRISVENNNLNIGSTWYSPSVWRTRVNTETKYLMLKYAFETLLINRVEIVSTTDNLRSQRAIERLGAIKEGILRKKYNNRDYVIYSILNTEWDQVQNRLEGFLEDGEYDIRNHQR